MLLLLAGVEPVHPTPTLPCEPFCTEPLVKQAECQGGEGEGQGAVLVCSSSHPSNGVLSWEEARERWVSGDIHSGTCASPRVRLCVLLAWLYHAGLAATGRKDRRSSGRSCLQERLVRGVTLHTSSAEVRMFTCAYH